MKNIVLSLFLGLFLVGCKPPVNPVEPPITPVATTLYENDNGRSYSAAKNTSIAIDLPLSNDNNFYWSLDGKATKGLVLVSETEMGSVVRFVVQAVDSGIVVIHYQQFTDLGGKIIKTFSVKVEVK
jgi:hypothetical protein